MQKYEIESLEGLDEAKQKLYEKYGDKFRLKIEGLEIPDVDGLKKKIEELLDEKKTMQQKAKDAEKLSRKAVEEAARKAGDIEAVEKSLRDKFQTELDEKDQSVQGITGQLRQLLVKNEAMRIAAANAVDSDSVPILAEWIEHRFDMDVRDGAFTTVVKGADGKPSGLSVDEFEKGLVKEKALARLLKASGATGGGAEGGGKGGGAAQQAKANWGGSKEERLAAIKKSMAQSA